MDNAEKAKNMIKIVIGSFESEIKKTIPLAIVLIQLLLPIQN
jgi:hypothetical protein